MIKLINLTIRGLKKNIGSSILTILGLSLAFTCCLIIIDFVRFEYSHDKFHKQRENIYKIAYTANWLNDVKRELHLHDHRLADRLRKDVPQIKNACAYRKGWGAVTLYKENTYDDILGIVEPEFLEIFSFKLLAGNSSRALEDPADVIISKQFADKLLDYNSEDYESLLGETIEFLNIKDIPFKISGVLEELPGPSSIKFEILINYHYQRYFGQSYACVGNSIIFVETIPGVEIDIPEATTKEIIKSYYQDKLSEFKSQGRVDDTENFFEVQYQNLSNMHFSTINNGYLSLSSKSKSTVLTLVGLMILIISCFNFLLFSIGRFAGKVTYVGVMKVFGASRENLIKLFWSETLLLTIISIILGLILSNLLLPKAEQFAEIELSSSSGNKFLYPAIILFALVLSVIITLPSIIVFQRINPVNLINRQFKKRNKSFFTNAYIVSQYVLASALIIGTLVIILQTRFMKTKSLGFNPEYVIELAIPSDFGDDKTNLLKERLLENPAIINVAGNDKGFMGNKSRYDVRNEKGDINHIRIIRVDNNYINTLGLELVEGEDFTESNLTRNNGEIIVNEEFVSVMDPSLKPGSYADIVRWGKFRIKAIVKDFHFDSMREEIVPLIMLPNISYERIRWLYIRYDESNANKIVSQIEDSWNSIAPGRVFNYHFLDERLSSRYQQEERWAGIIGFASVLAIIISSLGLFGLTLMTLNKRVKEIGIRKVNGATIGDVVLLLNKDFLSKIFLGFIIACPLAFIAMSRWLDKFPYKISIGPVVYIAAGLIVIIIALITINWKCWNAASRNPGDILRLD